ncbi:hypothetical protein BDV28DRAFT_145271 [Aspergillus coremiiformis]|uniref:Uncharacterized protein n=1 Tax=Aspergillus coremiiformis TaxID=138285 RepID=A0A5N6ZHJ8_9EURO|nr:hypothetical protein BDV28DRAFT_145271 [Aspergillus coremiiformis]
MSTPQIPDNKTEEYLEGVTFENVPGALNLEDEDPNIYLSPEQDIEERSALSAANPYDNINDENIQYLGDMDDG